MSQQQQQQSGGGSQTQSYTFSAEPRPVNAKARPKYRSEQTQQSQQQEHKDQQLSVNIEHSKHSVKMSASAADSQLNSDSVTISFLLIELLVYCCPFQRSFEFDVRQASRARQHLRRTTAIAIRTNTTATAIRTDATRARHSLIVGIAAASITTAATAILGPIASLLIGRISHTTPSRASADR